MNDGRAILNEERQYPVEKIGLMLCLYTVHLCSMMYASGPQGMICGESSHQYAMLFNVAVQVVFTLLWRKRCVNGKMIENSGDKELASVTDFGTGKKKPMKTES